MSVPAIDLVELAERPSWAGEPHVEVSPEFDAAQLDAINRNRDAIHAEARRAVTAYLAKPGNLFPTAEEGFPSLDRLSGEYYFGDRSYDFSNEPWFKDAGLTPTYSFEVEVRFLEHLNEHNSDDRDYLGLSVCFIWSVEDQTFQHDGINSAVI